MVGDGRGTFATKRNTSDGRQYRNGRAGLGVRNPGLLSQRSVRLRSDFGASLWPVERRPGSGDQTLRDDADGTPDAGRVRFESNESLIMLGLIPPVKRNRL